VLRAIESLSEALGMTVIAEGVESYEELAYLQGATRIRYAQGYYFSRPVTFEDMQANGRTTDVGRGRADGRLPRDHRFSQSRTTRRER
jgi:EAL domain-containing protein (putative c-di-GMP-specific phosphodiesterase class I)